MVTARDYGHTTHLNYGGQTAHHNLNGSCDLITLFLAWFAIHGLALATVNQI